MGRELKPSHHTSSHSSTGANVKEGNGPSSNSNKETNVRVFKNTKDGRRGKALQVAADALEPFRCGKSSSTNYMCWPPPVIDGHAIPASGWNNACCYRFALANNSTGYTFDINDLKNNADPFAYEEARMWDELGYPMN